MTGAVPSVYRRRGSTFLLYSLLGQLHGHDGAAANLARGGARLPISS